MHRKQTVTRSIPTRPESKIGRPASERTSRSLSATILCRSCRSWTVAWSSLRRAHRSFGPTWTLSSVGCSPSTTMRCCTTGRGRMASNSISNRTAGRSTSARRRLRATCRWWSFGTACRAGLETSSRWTEAPRDFKRSGDAALARGINRLVLHHWVHQPFGDDVRPGMSMGF